MSKLLTPEQLAALKTKLDSARKTFDAFTKSADAMVAEISTVVSFLAGLSFLAVIAVPLRIALPIFIAALNGLDTALDAVDDAVDRAAGADVTPAQSAILVPPPPYDPTTGPRLDPKRGNVVPELVTKENPLGCPYCFGTGVNPASSGQACPTCAVPPKGQPSAAS